MKEEPVAEDLSDVEIREQLIGKRDQVRASLARVEAALLAFDEEPQRRHKMGDEARKNISAAQRRRWAKWQGAQEVTIPPQLVTQDVDQHFSARPT
jgi:hypothetical protein